MSRSQLGREAYLFVNTGTLSTIGNDPTESGKIWTEIDLATDVTVDRSKNEIDSTNRGSAGAGWTVTQQGLKAFKLDFDAHRVAHGEVANAGNDLILGAFDSNEVVEILEANQNINTDPITNVRCTWSRVTVGGGQESQPLDDVVTVSVSLTNSDIPIPCTGANSAGTITLTPVT